MPDLLMEGKGLQVKSTQLAGPGEARHVTVTLEGRSRTVRRHGT